MRKELFKIGETSIYGNNHNVPLVHWWDLSEKEQADFDYLDNPEDNFTGFRYKGNVYGLDEFMRIDKYNPFYNKFDGHKADSFFSGILVKFTDDLDFVRVYTYIG